MGLLVNLTLRDLQSKYKRSALGWPWHVLNPVFAVVVYSAIFSVFRRSEPSIGDHQNGLVALADTWSSQSADAEATGPRSGDPGSDGS